ncbi:hypothetical protein SEVIR_3G316600v4 [Setaria viridis]|uniref:Strictosidine synthase conserved region domain-containing protein n=1 Tax=Setaria viridis TaxID=4556 RepID=A0A4U6VJR1_SETVI|nr:hypothetical protein SEVIR_3G316600v2 [Setaria viridis]
MSPNRAMALLVVVGILLPSSCAADAKQLEAAKPTPWSIQKPGSATQSLALEHIPLPHGVTGAESLAFDRRGQGPYTGVSDGRILRWDGSSNSWTTFAYNANYKNKPICTAPARRQEDVESICGRPLGLQFYAKTGDLYIADAYLGLMKVGSNGGEAEVLAAEAHGVPFTFTNGIDVDQVTGDIYFIDSSTTYTRARNTQIMIHRDVTGRLLRYNARAGRVTVLKAGLPYPNGVALSADRTHVVVAHTGRARRSGTGSGGPRPAATSSSLTYRGMRTTSGETPGEATGSL